MTPPGHLFGVIPAWVLLLCLTLPAFVYSAYLVYTRTIRLVLLGKRPERFDLPLRRLAGALSLVFGQKKVLQSVSLKRDRAGAGHFLIFWGFISFVFSYVIFTYGDAIWTDFSVWLLTETGVRVFSAYIDIFAALLLVVLAWAAVRRWVSKPHRLSFDLTQSHEAAYILVLISLLMVATLLTEAFFVASGGSGPATWVPIGSAIGRLFAGAGISESLAGGFHTFFWWTHVLIVLAFAIYIPLSKHAHIMAAPAAAYMRDRAPGGKLSTPQDMESAEHFGAGRVQDFTWKELLDGYACAVCGRCTESCPAHVSGKVLSPMHVVEGLKAHLMKTGTSREESKGLFTHIPPEAIWDCLTCGACERECPVSVEHIDTIVDIRRHLVMEQAEMPEKAMEVLMSMEQRGHPWRGTTFTRTDWAKGLNVRIITGHPQPEYLLWVGCTAALEQRSQAVARATASVLIKGGVDFAILGEEETCTGDPARRLGNEYLFQVMARKNIETFKRYGVKKIIALCPHCYNTLKNEYPSLGGVFEVRHSAEVVAELIAGGKLKPSAPVETTVAYHDPCYLGRHNRIYLPQRRIAGSIPGLRMIGIERSGEKSFCCGAGGGHMWMDDSGGKRTNHVRIEQMLESNAHTIAVSCPFCLQMLEEGINAKGLQEQKQVRDIVEMLDISTDR